MAFRHFSFWNYIIFCFSFIVLNRYSIEMTECKKEDARRWANFSYFWKHSIIVDQHFNKSISFVFRYTDGDCNHIYTKVHTFFRKCDTCQRRIRWPWISMLKWTRKCIDHVRFHYSSLSGLGSFSTKKVDPQNLNMHSKTPKQTL